VTPLEGGARVCSPAASCFPLVIAILKRETNQSRLGGGRGLSVNAERPHRGIDLEVPVPYLADKRFDESTRVLHHDTGRRCPIWSNRPGRRQIRAGVRRLTPQDGVRPVV
jgi:hypothetical protein